VALASLRLQLLFLWLAVPFSMKSVVVVVVAVIVVVVAACCA
jgi:hypothetical protein